MFDSETSRGATVAISSSLLAAVRDRAEPLIILALLVLTGPLGAAAALVLFALRNQRAFASELAERISQARANGFPHPELEASLRRLDAPAAVDALVVRTAAVPAIALGRTIVVRGSTLYRLLSEAGPAGLDAVLRHELAHISSRHQLRKDLSGHAVLLGVNVLTVSVWAAAATSSAWLLALALFVTTPAIEAAGVLAVGTLHRRLEWAADRAALRDGHGGGMSIGLVVLEAERDLFERAQSAIETLTARGRSSAVTALRSEFDPRASLSLMTAVVERAEARLGDRMLDASETSWRVRLSERWVQLCASHPQTERRLARCRAQIAEPNLAFVRADPGGASER